LKTLGFHTREKPLLVSEVAILDKPYDGVKCRQNKQTIQNLRMNANCAIAQSSLNISLETFSIYLEGG
jgi:hypothetical protein